MKHFLCSFLLSIFCLFLTISTISAQIQELTRIPSITSPNFFHFDDRILYFSYLDGKENIWEIDLISEKSSLLVSDLSDPESFQQNSKGLFFVTYSRDQNGNDGKHYLHYISKEGDTTNCGFISRSIAPYGYRPKYSTLSNDHFYITGYTEGTYNVWESDGTKEGSKVIFRSNQRIVNLESLHGDLLIAAQSDDTFELILYSQTDSLAPIKSFSKSQYNTIRTLPFESIGKDASYLYFNLNEESGKEMIWRTDGTPSHTEVFLEEHNASAISFKDDKFEMEKLRTGIYRNYIYLTGFTAMPEVLDTLRFSSTYKTPSQTVTLNLGDSLYLCGSYEYGHELGYRNEQDSLTLFEDYAKGSSSSVACYLPGFNFKCYNKESFLVENSQSVYAVLSNGNDPHFYLYHVSDSGFNSLFRVSDPGLLQHSFLFDQALYWFEFGDESRILKKYVLNQADREEQAKDAVRNKDAWLRQISAAYPSIFTPFSITQGIQLSARGIYLNDAGEVFVGAWVRMGPVILNSDTPKMTPKKGSFAITKYNPYGEILWQKTLGSIFHHSSFRDYFSLDKDGDLVVVGTYYKKAWFDQDSLTSPNAGYYIAKLSGKTGEFLWKKKLSETYYTNSIETELTLTFDTENNIYTSFLYRNSRVSYADSYLITEKRPVNALASFDPSGNPRWVKNIETPWLDTYGKTRILTFNKQKNTLFAAQSQGYFNVFSSCEFRDYGYYFQEIDLNGNIVDTFSFKGSDLGALVTGAYTDNGRFMGLGYHRGTLNFGPFSTTSTRGSEDCHETEGFVFELAEKSSEVIFGNTFSSPSVIPTDVKVYKDHIYIYGTRNNRLILLKYATDGAFIGYKLINQRARVFDFGDFGFFNFLDVKDGSIVLVGKKFQADALTQVNPLLAMEENISVLKLPDEDWIQDEESFDQISAMIQEQEVPLVAYPNPFDRFIRIANTPKGTDYDQFELFNVSGSLIQRGPLVGKDIYEFDFNQLSPGMYLLRFTGQNGSTTTKIMKR